MLAFLASEGALLPQREESHLSLAVGKSMNVWVHRPLKSVLMEEAK